MQKMPTFTESGDMNANTKTYQIYVSITRSVEWCRSKT